MLSFLPLIMSVTVVLDNFAFLESSETLIRFWYKRSLRVLFMFQKISFHIALCGVQYVQAIVHIYIIHNKNNFVNTFLNNYIDKVFKLLYNNVERVIL